MAAWPHLTEIRRMGAHREKADPWGRSKHALSPPPPIRTSVTRWDQEEEDYTFLYWVHDRGKKQLRKLISRAGDGGLRRI